MKKNETLTIPLVVNNMSANEKNLINSLFEKAKAGNMGAKNELYSLLYTRIFNYCHTIVKDYHYAQEAANEAFRKVFMKIEGIEFKGPDCFISYLYVTSRNVSINILKQLQRRKKLEVEYNSPVDNDSHAEIGSFIPDRKATSPRKIAIINEKIREIDQYCDTLTGTRKKIYELHKEGWTTKEIAKKLSVKYSTLRVKMTRLKQRLQKFNKDI